MKVVKSKVKYIKPIILSVGIVLILLVQFALPSLLPEFSKSFGRTLEKIILFFSIFSVLSVDLYRLKTTTEETEQEKIKVKENIVLLIIWIVFGIVMIVKDFL